MNPPTATHVDTTGTVIGLDRNLSRHLLFNVADAIQHVLMPQLSGSANARAAECAGILVRVVQSLGVPDAEVAGLFAQLGAASASPADWRTQAALEGRLLDLAAVQAVAAKLAAATPAPSGGRSFDAARCEHFLKSHPLGGPDVRITAHKQLAGGRSKQTILISLTGAKNLPADCVIRQDWASAVTGTSVISEFELLKRVFDAGLRVPQPLLLEKSVEALGAPFLVVTRMPGGPQGDLFNPPKSAALAVQVAQQLAALHRLPMSDFTALGVATEAHTTEQLRAGLEGFRKQQAQLGTPSRTIDIAIDWMAGRIDRVDGDATLVHNDLGCHNFLIDGENLTAILDWELASIGNPAADLGYIRGWISQMLPWDDFMAAYYAAGAAPVSATTLDFYTLWCGVRLYCLLLQARAGVAMGAVRDTEITFAVAEFLPVLLHRISSELRAVLDA